jgi:hypothetical protein
MEPHRLQPLNPMLGATNSGLALAPVAKSRAAPAHNPICVQSKDLSAPTTGSADELQEDAARTHAKTDDFGGDWRTFVFLKRQHNTRHIERQSA